MRSILSKIRKSVNEQNDFEIENSLIHHESTKERNDEIKKPSFELSIFRDN